MDAAATPDLSGSTESEQLRARLAELEQTATRRAHELTALHEIALEIGRLTDLNTLLHTIVEKAASLLNAQMGGLYLVRPEDETVELVVAHHLPGQWVGTQLRWGTGVSGRVAQTGRVLTVPDYQAWAGRAAVYDGVPFRRVIGVPMKIGSKVIGVINITDDQRTGDFAEDEIRLVTLFAEQAALAVEKAQLLAEVQNELAERQRAAQVQSSLYRITEAVHTAQNLEELYRSIHSIIADLMPARNFGIALYNAATRSFNFPYRVDEHYPGEFSPPPRPAGRTLVDYVWRTGAPLLVTTAQIEQLAAEQDLQLVGVMALDWLGVPLKWQDQTIGVMAVQTYTAGERLTEEHQQILQFISAQIAMAIQRKRTEQTQQAIYRISEAAQTTASLEDLYPAVHAIVNELMPARNFYIALSDPASDLITFPYLVDEYDDVTPIQQPDKSLTAYVLRTGQPLFASPEVFDELVRRGEVELIGGASVDWIGVPLKVRDKVIGIIAVQSYSEHVRLTEEHRDLLGFVSTQVAMAIQRKQTEQVRAAIYHIAEAAQTARNLNELYQAIHRIVSDLMPARNFYLALYDRPSTTVTFEYFVDEVHSDVRGVSRQGGQSLTNFVLQLGEPWLGTKAQIEAMLEQGQVTNIGPVPEFWLGAPLQVAGESIGLLAVQSYLARVPLTDEHKAILQYVSAQVAMAIHRKRAEEALRESEEKYRILFSNDLVPITIFDAINLQLVDVNMAFVRLYGYSREELLGGMTIRDISAEPERSAAAVQQALAGGTMSVPLRYHRKKDGTIFPVELVSGPFLWKDRTTFFAWIQDITERKRSETALRDSEQRYHDLFEAAQRQAQELTLLDRVRTAMTGELNLAELFRTVVNAIADTFGYTLVSLYVLDDHVLRLQHQVGYDLVLSEVPLASGVMGRVARSGRPELVEDVFAEPAFLATMDDIISEVAVPLLDAGRVAGVLNIESTRGYRLTEADLRLMIALSEHVNTAITRARLYTEARQNAARLTAAIESLPFDFWAIGLDGRYVLQNSASTQHWGDRLGKQVAELDLPDEVRAHWLANDQRAMSGQVIAGEIQYLRAGEVRHFHEIIAPIWSEGEIQGIIGVNIDITDRQRAEAALRLSEARLRAITTNIPIVLFALDTNGTFTLAEGQGLDALGRPVENLIGKSVFEVMQARPQVVEALQLALQGEALNFMFDVDERKYEMWLSPLATAHGEFDGVIGVAVDITERERTEEALRRAQKMESLGLLAGGIAHDFNNLLVAILGQTSLALSQVDEDNPARAPIEKAVSAARRASDLTRQLLAYSGRGQFERRPIDLNRLIQENLHLFEVAVPKQVALRSDLVTPLPVIVGDAGQLQQVVMNLVINAAEAIGDKSGEVVVRTRRMRLSREAAVAWQIGEEALAAGDYVLLSVSDNGHGMDAETLARIFDPFFSTKFTGRGLGLAAVLGIVRGHNGGLIVTSAPQAGTTFEIILPGGETAAPESPPAPAWQEVDMAQQLVLVIDDEAPVRDAVADILDLEGVVVLSAPDGRAGIDLYRQRQADISLIMLDLSMPGLNGEETFRELRAINPDVRVLLSSGYSQDEVAARFAGQSAVGFIQKPYDAEQLVKEVRRQLAQQRGGRS